MNDQELRQYLRKHPEVVAALKGRALQTEFLAQDSRLQACHVRQAVHQFQLEADHAEAIKPFLELEYIPANPYALVGGTLAFRRWLKKQEKISLHVYMPTYLLVGAYT
jgi:hypothetical protein